MGQIYALFSDRDGLPRYVGSTEHDAQRSLSRIVTKALKDREPGALYDWVLDEHRREAEVHVHVLEDGVAPADLPSTRLYWAEQFVDLLQPPEGRRRPSSVTAVGRTAISAMNPPKDEPS